MNTWRSAVHRYLYLVLHFSLHFQVFFMSLKLSLFSILVAAPIGFVVMTVRLSNSAIAVFNVSLFRLGSSFLLLIF